MTLTNRERQARAMSEADLLEAVQGMLEALGYIHKHDRPARYESGRMATHFEGHGGFPDIVAIHPRTGMVLLFELKVELPSKGVVSDDQQIWLDALAVTEDRTGMLKCGVWRPMQWLDGTIGEILVQGSRIKGDQG